jgi:amino acid transporter
MNLKISQNWKWRLGVILAIIIIAIVMVHPTLRHLAWVGLKVLLVVSLCCCLGLVLMGIWFNGGRQAVARAGEKIRQADKDRGISVLAIMAGFVFLIMTSDPALVWWTRLTTLALTGIAGWVLWHTLAIPTWQQWFPVVPNDRKGDPT